MFLSIELPGGDKGVSLFVRDLAGEENYRPGEPNYDFDSDRVRVNRAIRMANEALGEGPHKAFSMLFNQFDWPAVTGWEYWSRDHVLIFKHALLTARALGLPLHAHANLMHSVMAAAIELDIKFDFDIAKPLEAPSSKEFEHTNGDLERGLYFVLDVPELPADMPAVPEL